MQPFLVEYVTTALPRRKPERWPDILKPGSFFEVGCELATLWFDATLPPGTPAGEYTSTITITPQGRNPVTLELQVTATGWDLPLSPSLHTAFCFSPSWARQFYGTNIPADKRRDIYRFLLQHRLEPMDLWSQLDIGEEYLDDAAAHGKSLLFLQIDKNIRQKADHYRELIAKYQGRMKPIFFGYDEVLVQTGGRKLSDMQRDYQIAHELFPEIPRLNTARVDERLFGYVDIWCPKFNNFDASDAAKRKALGEVVWWYPTEHPPKPFANFNLDQPGIDPRILPWMSWKLGITGILYWGLNREWLTKSPTEAKLGLQEEFQERGLTWLTSEVQQKLLRGEVHWPDIPWIPYFRSVFNPRHIANEPGGGNLLYPAPDFQVWPSIRLKNLRDGLQDYEYLVMLQKEAARLRELGNQTLAQECETILRLDDSLVKDATHYTKQPEELYSYRQLLLFAIQNARKQWKLLQNTY